MAEQAQFSITLQIRDNRTGDTYTRAMSCDEALRISARAVDEMRSPIGPSVVGFDGAVQMMRTREFRRDLLVATTKQLALQLADTLQDAEGWHDASRIEPARVALSGKHW